jgi:beta-N-acetylhexosaminidase
VFPDASARPRAVSAPRVTTAALSAAVGLLLCLPAGAQGGVDGSANRLSDGQLAGQRVIVGFGGERLPERLEARIRHGLVAGVVLFSDNFDDRDEARALIRDLQAIPRPPGLRAPLLVMLDQEGGLVKRLDGPPAYSADEMGDRSSRFCARQGEATGRNLREVGVNVDLAPVLDVARPGSAMQREHRSFGADPDTVTRKANAFAAGLQAEGVAATAKHFPGFGAADTNTDLEPERIGLSRRTLRDVDMRPYRRFAREHGRLVMLSMAVYPAFDDLPAALSRALATHELRDRLGFRGVSITDALGTPAAAAVGGPRELARKGARAGADLLLYSSLRDGVRATGALKRALRSGAIPRHNFIRSARRVLSLRERLGR